MSRVKSIVPQSIMQQSNDIQEDEVLMIIRNMAGEELRIVVKKTAFFTDVRAYVAERADLKYCETRLMVNYTEPDGLTPIHSLVHLLEERNVVDLLVDTEQTEFDCILCLQRRKISECREWNSQPELCCVPCEGRPHMCCWLDVEDNDL
jgi:hypothetical protein